jgi:CTP:molybdopterin cytidylyltransferase MocA
MGVVGIVLAAGGGSRMGMPKANLVYRGEPLISRAVRTAFAGGCDRVLAVLGAEVEQASSSAEAAGAFVVVNPAWAEGMGISLRSGLDAIDLLAPDASAALVMLVDQPHVTQAAVAAVLSGQRDPADETVLAAAAYEGKRGHPVLLGRAHWSALRPTLVGDVGARTYLREHRDELILVPCETLADPRDLDRPEDLDALG